MSSMFLADIMCGETPLRAGVSIKPIFSIRNFSKVWKHCTDYRWNITFKCYNTWAATTAIKYESDSKNLTGFVAKIEKNLNGNINERSFGHPLPGVHLLTWFSIKPGMDN